MEDHTKFRDAVLTERDKGNVVIYTIEGPMVMKLDDIINQPTEGLLYDLNRDLATVLTRIEDPKWVNDFAVALVITKLKEYWDAGHKPAAPKEFDYNL